MQCTLVNIMKHYYFNIMDIPTCEICLKIRSNRRKKVNLDIPEKIATTSQPRSQGFLSFRYFYFVRG